MAKQVQIRRGTSTECDAFTGVVGELFYDTTNKRVRVSDGATAGGIVIPKYSEIILATTAAIRIAPFIHADLGGL